MSAATRPAMTLLVAEIFGPTFQGEGFSLGRRAAFVRLGRCNLDCGQGAGYRVAPEVPEIVVGDPVRLNQVVVNLLEVPAVFSRRRVDGDHRRREQVVAGADLPI